MVLNLFPARWHTFLLAFILFQPAVAQDQAIDRVIVRRENTRREVTYTGRVLEYANRILRFRMQTSGGIRQFKSNEVVRIETPQTEPHREGLKLFAAGKYQAAIQTLEAAAKDEPRDWVKRDILALLSRIHLKFGKRLEAARAFVRLTNSDPTTHHFGSIPLWWNDTPPSAEAQRMARAWLEGPNLSARLISASILFHDPATRREANTTLDQLARSGRQHVIDLARVQQWRGALAEKRRITDGEIAGWKRRLKSMKPAERGGPWFLIGRGYATRMDYEKAALAYFWVPLVYKDDEWLAAESNLGAALALEKAGRLVDAESTYRETATRYSRTPFATIADNKLKPRPQNPSTSDQ